MSSSAGGSPACRFLILASTIQMGFFAWAFYAAQPYLLGLLDSDATWIAGFIAAGIALSTIAGNQVVTFASRHCGRRTTLLLAAAGVETAAAVAVGLASSFWVALPALLVMTASMGVTSPVHSAYLHQVVSSEQRATVVSFDSMISNTGGVVGQLGWARSGRRARSQRPSSWAERRRSQPPFLARIRRLGGPPTPSSSERAGAKGPCAGSGIPADSSVETGAAGHAELAGAGSRA